MGIFTNKKVSRLEDRVRDLTAEKIYLESRVNDNQNDINRESVRHVEEIGRLKNNHTLEINELQRKYDLLEGDFDSKLEKATKDEKASLIKAKKNLEKDFEIKTKKLEKDYEAKFKQLHNEYVEKLAKMDKKLEEDKAAYRKYLRQEHNNEVENLQKENKRLFTENQTLIGKNAGLEKTVGILEKQISSVTKFADDVAGNINSLSTKIAEGMVKSMPTVNADITTPEVVVQLPKQDNQPSKTNNNGGEQKK